MNLAIMQPYFLPYLGYFSLIKHVDHFVFFDTPQFIRHGWIDRNRILKPEKGWQYINVPSVKHPRETPINRIVINNTLPWKQKLKAQLAHYKNKTHQYKITMDLIESILAPETDSLVDLNIHALQQVMNHLELPFRYSVFSEMGIHIAPPNAPDEWALQIAREMKATKYINPIGGLEFFNKEKYNNSNIKLLFMKHTLPVYKQHNPTFEPGLSILDVLMFNDKKEIVAMLDAVEFID